MTDVTPSTTPDEVLERRQRLYDATRLLQRCVQTAPDDPYRWRADLEAAVVTVSTVMTDHITATEEPAGFFDLVLDETGGRFNSWIEELRAEHERSTDLLAGLRDGIEAGRGADSLRRSAAELFDQLDAHRHRGADLLWEAYGQEIDVQPLEGEEVGVAD